jgi:hypothetical protein
MEKRETEKSEIRVKRLRVRYRKLSETEEIKTQKILRDKQTEINTEMIRKECGREKVRKGQNSSDRV